MARERAKLTDKEEKILIQAQLMGLSTASMVKIGNRLRAIERESELRSEVENLASKFKLSKLDNGWLFIDETGHHYKFTDRKLHYNARMSWTANKEIRWDVEIDKPGTRYKLRSLKAVKIYISPDYPAKLCPEKNKEVFAIMKMIKQGQLDK